MPQSLKRKTMDYCKEALLRSTVTCFCKKVRMEVEEAEQMFPNDPPLHKISKDNTPGSCTSGAAEMFMESRKESPSTYDVWETGVSPVGSSTYPTSIFSEEPAGQGAHEDPGCDPSSSDLQEILNGVEDLEINPGKASEQCLEEPASPVADVPNASSSEKPTSTFQREAGVCDCFSPEEPLHDPPPGNLEALVAQNLGGLSLEDSFDGKDTLEFKTTPAPQPREEEITQGFIAQEAIENLLHILAQDASGIDGPEEFVMMELTAE